MLDFPIKTLNTIKRILYRQQKDIEKNIDEFEQEDPVKSPALAESSEPGTESFIADSHAKIIILQQQLKQTSQNIGKALLKIKKGAYGKCERCDKQIEIGRLLAMPTTKYCLSCSKKVVK